MNEPKLDADLSGAEAAWRAQLRAFIVGTGEFENRRGDPRVDYGRWRELQDYYQRLDDRLPEKSLIRQVILDLFDDRAARYASVTLSRLLGFRELENKITALVQSDEFDSLPDHLQKATLHAAAQFQIGAMSTCIVRTMVLKSDLLTFLLWGTMPGKQVVTPNDHWRMNALAHYYETEADCKMRSLIGEQLRGLATKYPEIHAIFEAFVDRHSRDSDEFLRLLRNELGGQTRY